MDTNEFMQYVMQYQIENQNQIIVVETPDYHAEMRLGDILIYKGMRGELVFDNE